MIRRKGGKNGEMECKIGFMSQAEHKNHSERLKAYSVTQ